MPDAPTTPVPSPHRIFLSYARDDDEPFVCRLYTDLTAAGFTVWYDRKSLMSRGLTFHQEIKDAIRTEVDRVVYVHGPHAAASAYVREEIRFALECDHVVVTPILRLGDYLDIPATLAFLHCEDFRQDAAYPTSLQKLIHDLRQPNPPLGALFGVPTLPAHFLARPDLMSRVRDALLVDLQTPLASTSAAATVGVQGMGGIGKSVLVAALARDRQIRQSYPDGVAWISCGQHLSESDLVQRQRDLGHYLGGNSNFNSLAQGQAILRQLLANKAVLVILDGVWHAAHAQAFDLFGPRCRMLVTTRDAGILQTLHGHLVPVSLFTESQALQLLADSVNTTASALPPEAHEVAHECGRLPLALALSGGMAKARAGDFNSVLERLRRADLEKVADRQSINPQHISIWRAMHASVEMLPDDQQHRFTELAIFPADQTIPQAAATTFWSHSGNLDAFDTEDLLIELAQRSLIQLDQKTDLAGTPTRRFRLHDLLHDYATRTAGNPQTLHQELLDAYRKKCPGGWPFAPNDGYFLQNARFHFPLAARENEWFSLLLDLRWAQAKVLAGLAHDLVKDYAVLPSKDDANHENSRILQQLAQAVSQEAYNLSQATRINPQSAPAFVLQQLRNRVLSNSRGQFDLATSSPGDWSGIILHQHPLRPALFSRRIALEPGTTTHRSLGGVKFTPDGKLLVAAIGRNRVGRIIPETGLELEPLTSHGRAIAVDFSPDGALLVLGGDLRPHADGGFVQVFDLASGKSLAVRELPSPVIKLVVNRDYRVITNGCPLVHVLSLPSLTLLETLDPFDNGAVFSVAIDRSRQVLAFGEYHNKEEPARIRVYDALTLQQKTEVSGPKYGITSLAFSDLPGILASGSQHLNNGVVAWQWQLPGSKYDPLLLSAADHDYAVHLIQTEGRQEHARLGRIISILRTDDTIGGLCFYPQSSRLIAVEGTLNRTADNIYVYDILGDRPGDIPRLAGHTSFPIGIDIDPSGRFAATVHAKGEVYIWPAQDIEHAKPAKRHGKINSPSTDANGEFILSREGDYGFIQIFDTKQEQEVSSSSMRPSHAAAVSPSGDWFARFYWEQFPITPYGGEEAQAWFKAFREQVPICCHINPIPESQEPHLAWRLSPNINIHNIAFDPTGKSGAALLSDESGHSVFWFSPLSEAAAYLEIPAPLKPHRLHFPHPRELVVFSEAGGQLVAHAAHLGDDNQWFIQTEFRGFGPAKEITCGPIPLGDDLFALVKANNILQVYAAQTPASLANGPTRVISVRQIASTESSDGIFDIAKSGPRPRLIVTNTYPALAVYSIPALSLTAWRPLDQACHWVFSAQKGAIGLVVGAMPEITGIHYSMMSIPE